ncbi:MAG: ATP-binding protein [Candidatus Omnitrophota bacterium]
MKIVTKLTLSFLIVASLVLIVGYVNVNISQKELKESIGENSSMLAKETMERIDQSIYRIVQIVKLYSHSISHIEELEISNREFDELEDVGFFIDVIEKEWGLPKKDNQTTFMKDLINNDLSAHLREDMWLDAKGKKEYGFTSVVETFITNKYGVNAAQTGATSDYYQADEEWWQVAKEKGLYIGDVKFDASAERYAIDISSSIIDRHGKFMGIIKMVLGIEEIVNIVISLEEQDKIKEKSRFYAIKLINKDGKVIYSTEKASFKIFEELDKDLLKTIKENEKKGYLVRKGDKSGESERMYSFSSQHGYRDFKGFNWMLIIERETKGIFAQAKKTRKILLVFSFFVTIIAIILGFFISRTVSIGLIKLRNAATEISKGAFDTTIDIKSKDEVGELALSFRKMSESLKDKKRLQETWTEELEEKIKESTREISESQVATLNMMEDLQGAYSELKKAQFSLIQAEKMEGIGRMASGVAHEVKNPLGIVLQGVNFLEKNIPKSQKENYKVLDLIKNNIKRADNIVTNLVDFSKATKLETVPVDINIIIEESLSFALHNLNVKDIEIVKEFSENLPKVKVDRIKISQVYVNLIRNAIQSMIGKGKLFLRTYEIVLEKPEDGVGRRFRDNFAIGEKAVVIEIEDTGCGISEDNLEKIFEPFFTTKDPQSGTGLGLAITKNIIDLHRAHINVESELKKGTKFFIYLKVA